MERKNSSIEILRIVAMFFIVLSHCCVHGLKDVESSIFFNNVILDICVLGNLGVVIFILITGYLSVNKDFKLKKIFKLEFITITYSLLFLVIKQLVMGEVFLGELIKSFFPILSKRYWFMTAYICLYVFTPFINSFINSISKKKFLNLIYISVFSCFIIPTFTTADLYFNELFQFITLYCIGGYIRKYIISDHNIYKKTNRVLYMCVCCLVISAVIIEGVAKNNSILSEYSTYFFNRNSIFILLLGICILILVIEKGKEKESNKMINLISSTMLGVYLIHDNPSLRTILWNDVIDLTEFVDKPYLIVVLILTSIIILLVCITIELLRQKFLDKVFEKNAQKLETYLTKKLYRLYSNNDGKY